MNQLGVILAGHAGTIVWLKAALTYLTPLIVSNFGVLSAPPARVARPDPRHSANVRRLTGPTGCLPACAGKDTTMDETKMMEFVGRAVDDVGAVLGGAMVVIGDKLGLYRSMAGAGSLTPAELAERTGTAERYVREWLSAQAARGYVSYDGDATATAVLAARRARRARSPTRPAPPA